MIARRSLAVALFLATACAPIDDTEPAAPEDPAAEDTAAVPPPFDDTAKLRWVRANACDDQSPMSLTASDGTGLALKTVKARAAVEGPVALTELQLSFDNPEDRQLEGRFAITLPPGAAISRFAMKIGDQWQEGEVVERQAARRAYEDFLHRRQDPALLENDAGNVFRARVFPIPPRGTKDLIIAYSQTLPAEGEPWRLPLCGLPTLGELDVDVAIVRGAAYVGSSLGGKATSVQHLTLREQDFAPKKDLEAWAGDARAQGVRHGDLAIARVKPQLTTTKSALDELTILFDTSASRALDFSGQVDRLQRLIAALAAKHPGMDLKVVAFDQHTTSIFEGPASDFGTTEVERLRRRGALGASDLQFALQSLDSDLASPRVLLIGDGVATAGGTEAAELTKALRGLSRAGVQRFDALVDGGIQDAEMLAQLTREALETDGILLDARMELSSIVDKLGRATRSGITVDVPGAEWVWPTTLDGVQSGDEVLVYAQLPPDQAFEVVLEGAQVADESPRLARVPGPLLGRAHAEARISSLQAELSALDPEAQGAGKRRTEVRDRIIELSTRHRVLSDFTALLVLETEDDYRRFGIERNALTDIMTVGPAGVDLMRRAGPQQTSAPQPPIEPELEDEVPPLMKEVEKKKASKGRGGRTNNEQLMRRRFDADDLALEEDEDEASVDADKAEAFGGDIGGDRLGGADGAAQLGGRAVPADPSAVRDVAPTVAAAEPEPEPEPPARIRAGVGGSERGRASRHSSRVRRRPPPRPTKQTPKKANAWDGRFDGIMKSLAAGETDAARDEATAWRKAQPGDVLALVALGETFEAAGDDEAAARAYGSLIDLFPSRADLRRMAGERLERLDAAGLKLATDTYDKALKSRPDQPTGARLLAYALAKQGDFKAAFETLEAAFDRQYPSGRFAQIHRILREDLGLIGKAWIAAEPSAAKSVQAALSKRGASLPSTPSTRFVLTWETDANDVDLHVYDARGNHAYYSDKDLDSGGKLYADVTTGYGPECFTIDGKPSAGPYTLQAHYYRRGPMGYGMGKLQVLTHDGNGHLTFVDEPFVIMRDDAYVDLAKIGR